MTNKTLRILALALAFMLALSAATPLGMAGGTASKAKGKPAQIRFSRKADAPKTELTYRADGTPVLHLAIDYKSNTKIVLLLQVDLYQGSKRLHKFYYGLENDQSYWDTRAITDGMGQIVSGIALSSADGVLVKPGKAYTIKAKLLNRYGVSKKIVKKLKMPESP